MRPAPLGQHFLTRPETAQVIATSVPLPQSGVVLEIGPGHGILTQELLRIAKKVVAIEKDARLFEELTITFEKDISSGRLLLLCEDVRTFSPTSCEALHDGYALIANIPYYITGYIVRTFLTTERQPTSMAVLMQKEVAERIVAKDGKQSVLSLSVAIYGTPAIKKTIKAGAFSPPPKVDSAILTIESISRERVPSVAFENYFFSLVKTAFSQKRKIVSGTLKKIVPENVFINCGIKKTTRPEDMLLEDWICLANKNLVKTLVE